MNRYFISTLFLILHFGKLSQVISEISFFTREGEGTVFLLSGCILQAVDDRIRQKALKVIHLLDIYILGLYCAYL